MEKKKILVVEDDIHLRRAISEKLGREGFSVLEAEDGTAGLAAALREKPDLILLDIVMPKMDGLTLLSNLRKDERGKTIQVIMLTNLSDEESVMKSLNEAAFDYLVKADWSLEDIVQKVRKRLGLE